VVGSYYLDRPFDFVPATNQYAALEMLANSDPVLVPVPDDSNSTYPHLCLNKRAGEHIAVAANSEYLLLQRYVLVLFYLDANGDTLDGAKWLKDQAASMSCNWSGVACSDDSSIYELDRTYNTVKTEPVICNMRSSLTAVIFSKSVRQQPFRKPSY
jgi:hypothetical protein